MEVLRASTFCYSERYILKDPNQNPLDSLHGVTRATTGLLFSFFFFVNFSLKKIIRFFS